MKYNQLTNEEFVKKATQIHGNKYDYSKVNYVNNHTNICIICPEHGEFWQRPDKHLIGHNCPICSRIKRSKSKTSATDKFTKKAKQIHGDKYDYSKVEYKKSSKKVCIICREHGEFWQTPNAHLSGHGCKKCMYEKLSHSFSFSNDEFIEKARQVHGNKYDYSKVNYKNYNTPVCIICKKHGEFYQTPNNHLKGEGCNGCKESLLETEVKNFLTENNINFIQECGRKTLKWLGYKKIDFYLPDYNVAIECQGIQHFTPTPFFDKYDDFSHRKKRDMEKKKLCLDNNIKLLYFSHEKYDKLNDITIINNIKSLLKEIKETTK